MRPEEALLAFWADSPAVAAVLGAPLRAWPEQGPDDGSGTFPRIVYAVLSDDLDQAIGGTSFNGFARLRFECQGYGATGYSDVRDLADLLLEATGGGSRMLQDFGPAYMPSAAAADKLWVQAVLADDVQLGQPEPAPGGAARPIHLATFELVLNYYAG